MATRPRKDFFRAVITGLRALGNPLASGRVFRFDGDVGEAIAASIPAWGQACWLVGRLPENPRQIGASGLALSRDLDVAVLSVISKGGRGAMEADAETLDDLEDAVEAAFTRTSGANGAVLDALLALNTATYQSAFLGLRDSVHRPLGAEAADWGARIQVFTLTRGGV